MNTWTHMATNARPNPRCGIVRDPCHTAALALSTLGDSGLVIHNRKGCQTAAKRNSRRPPQNCRAMDVQNRWFFAVTPAAKVSTKGAMFVICPGFSIRW